MAVVDVRWQKPGPEPELPLGWGTHLPSRCCEDCAESTVKDCYLSSCLYMHAYVYAFSPGIRNFVHLSSFHNIHLLLTLDITPLLSSITFPYPFYIVYLNLSVTSTFLMLYSSSLSFIHPPCHTRPLCSLLLHQFIISTVVLAWASKADCRSAKPCVFLGDRVELHICPHWSFISLQFTSVWFSWVQCT